MSPKRRPMDSLPSAIPHFGKYTWASSANRSRMLPPVEVTPALSKALRYSSATDLRCSSVMVWIAMAMRNSLCGGWAASSGRGRGQLVRLPDRFTIGRLCGPVREGDDRAQGGPAGPVRLSGRGGDAVADAVEARDRRPCVVED